MESSEAYHFAIFTVLWDLAMAERSSKASFLEPYERMKWDNRDAQPFRQRADVVGGEGGMI